MSFAQLPHAQLKKALLQRANLEGVHLQGAYLRQAQLQHANLEDAHLQGATLRNARLQEAYLTGAHLQGANLRRAQLQDARLQKSELQGADLYEAQLQGADLRYVDMEEDLIETGCVLTPEGHVVAETAGYGPADLTGCDLRGAILEGARLSSVKGLQSLALGGANLLRARLPDEIAEFKALGTVAEISARARGLFLSAIGACLYSWLTIASTRDVELLTNSASTPLPIIQTQIPIAWFYWVAPAILLALFCYLHLYLQRLWEALASLPAIFPSGRGLHEEAYPWLLSSLTLAFVPMLRDRRPSLWWLQILLSVLAAWILVPCTIVGFWARYLPRHDWLGTVLIAIFIVIAATAAVAFWRRAAATLRTGHAERVGSNPVPEALTGAAAVLFVAAVSVAAIESGSRFDVAVLRSFANVTDEDLSTRPSDWWAQARENELDPAMVGGARLAGRNLRVVVAEDAFLVKADLHESDLRGANLSGANLWLADLSGADIRGADLRNANLIGAKLSMADLDGADLRGAVILDCADLKAAVNWQSSYRYDGLACGAPIPKPPSEE